MRAIFSNYDLALYDRNLMGIKVVFMTGTVSRRSRCGRSYRVSQFVALSYRTGFIIRRKYNGDVGSIDINATWRPRSVGRRHPPSYA